MRKVFCIKFLLQMNGWFTDCFLKYLQQFLISICKEKKNSAINYKILCRNLARNTEKSIWESKETWYDKYTKSRNFYYFILNSIILVKFILNSDFNFIKCAHTDFFYLINLQFNFFRQDNKVKKLVLNSCCYF